MDKFNKFTYIGKLKNQLLIESWLSEYDKADEVEKIKMKILLYHTYQAELSQEDKEFINLYIDLQDKTDGTMAVKQVIDGYNVDNSIKSVTTTFKVTKGRLHKCRI